MIHLEPFDLTPEQIEQKYFIYRKTLWFVCYHARIEIPKNLWSDYLKNAIDHFRQEDERIIERMAIDNLHLGYDKMVDEYDSDAWIAGDDGYEIIKRVFKQS